MIRVCLPKDVPNWINFLDEVFEYVAPQSVKEDFAPFFVPENIGNARLFFDEKDKIVASASLFAHQVITAAGSARIGVIGAVATAEDARGKGHATQILQDMEICGRLNNVDGMLLWSDKEDFYSKLGFNPVGHQEIFSLVNIKEPAKVNAVIQSFWTEDQVRPLYNMHASRVKRSDQYWDNIRKITSCTRLQAVDSQGKVVAYMAMNRGKDLQNIIHEWGGDGAVLHAMAWSVQKLQPEVMWMTHPALVDPIRAQLPADEVPLIRGPLALFKGFKPIDPAILDTMWFWGLDSL